jgi:signal transduction histidine kinase
LGLLVALGVAGATAAALAEHTHSALQVALAAVVIVWAGAGAFAVRTTASRCGWLALLGASSGAAASIFADIASRSTVHPLADSRSATALLGLLTGALVVHGLVALPDGRLGTTSRRVVVAMWYVVAVAAGLAVVVRGAQPPDGALIAGWAAALATTGVPAAYARYATSVGASRQRLQWLGVGVVAAAEVALVAATLSFLVRWPSDLGATVVAASALVPFGLLAASNQALLARGGRLLVHAVAALGVTAAVAAIYVVAVVGIASRPNGTADRELLGVSLAAAAVVAVGFRAVRDRLVDSATNLVYGTHQAPDEVIRTFGSRLTRAVPMDELLYQLAESLRRTMALASAEVYTGSGEVLDLTVSIPDTRRPALVVSGRERPVVTTAGASGSAWASVWLPAVTEGRGSGPMRVVPVSHGGELLGLFVVEREAGAASFSEEDDRVLTELARQVGLAFHNAQLDSALQSSLDELRRQADELRASRARIVAASDATRRRVERDLHDGAQQHLVALAVNLRLTRDVVFEDPEAAATMIDELGTAVQDTIREVRELAHGIYPPLLVDAGLGEALRAIASRSPLDVEVVCEGIGRYDGDVEAAIYFCCLEALQNAAKHAPESHVVVEVREGAGGLVFEVRDDGPGFDVRLAQRGHGFVNMSDRLGAIGGSVRWESAPGRGTQIKGSVPL